jgi:rifampicin phosphotransferase
MSATAQGSTDRLLLLLDSPHADLALVGGKGANLARLARRGFSVPGGFMISTHAYQHFTRDLHGWLGAQIQQTQTDDPDALEKVSDLIRTRFRQTEIPAEMAAAICDVYVELGRPPVAVRSSATAEDLPDLSFAGQQDTFLNIIGEEALLHAVRECWSSLWTARAIGYRSRNAIDHAGVALAVVVQEMVQSEVSGVLFTADPLSGRRTETVIDATWGLGEALVSGLVEPDHYVVQTETGRILEKRLGAKATVIRGVAGGGTITESAGAAGDQALPDEAIQELARLGKAVADEYAAPQDIEWAFTSGRLYLLQSRPITSLYPLPRRKDADGLRIYLSFGAIQGMLAPLTPLGQDSLRLAAAGGANLFGYKADMKSQGVFNIAGERIWIDLTNVLRNGLGRKFFTHILPIVDPGSGDALRSLFEDPRLAPTADGLSQATIERVRPLALRIGKRLLMGLLRPGQALHAVQATVEDALAQTRKAASSAQSLADAIALHERICTAAFALLIPTFMPRIAAGYLPLNLLHRLATYLTAIDPAIDGQTAMAFTRALPHNVTTEMDLALWQLAQAIRQNEEATAVVKNGEAAQLAQRYLEGGLPQAAQQALQRFLDRYGMRGLAEIDFGRQRWREDPTPLIRTLQSYLTIDAPNMAPDAVFQRGEEAAVDAIEQLAQAAQRQWGRAGGSLVRWLAWRVRTLAGLRESPKFTIIQLFGISRQVLLRQGEALVAAGILDRADDLFFLLLDELKVLSMGAPGDWRKLVARRRHTFERELRRQPIPRLLLSDGAAIYEGMGAVEGVDGVIVGSPVSAGVVEGRVRVVFDPSDANLQPGEILVCPGTDPAWTPLFLAAGGLVMEVGGLMTHGSVVAREYGIPAVVGVDRATQRLKTGQRVRVDGAMGQIVVIEDEENE